MRLCNHQDLRNSRWPFWEPELPQNALTPSNDSQLASLSAHQSFPSLDIFRTRDASGRELLREMRPAGGVATTWCCFCDNGWPRPKPAGCQIRSWPANARHFAYKRSLMDTKGDSRALLNWQTLNLHLHSKRAIDRETVTIFGTAVHFFRKQENHRGDLPSLGPKDSEPQFVVELEW